MRLTLFHPLRHLRPTRLFGTVSRPMVVPLCVAGSFLFHAAAFTAVRALPADPTPPPADEAMVAFTVEADEPEPEVVPEPEPEEVPEPEPEPEAPPRPVVRPDPEPEETPEPEPEDPPEPEEALAKADEEPPEDDAPEDAPLEQEATPDALAGHGIASAEGGLAVAARAGDGSGLRGGRTMRPGRPTPPGPSIDPRALARQWMVRVGKLINERAGREYPLSARRRRLEGVAKVAIHVDAEGRITNVTVEKSSGHGTLDEAALAAIRRLGRVPAPPKALHWRGQRPIGIPIAYRIR
ncbi:MAG: energy transducer TonB family protein [Myxococcota bacterium]